MCHDDNGDQCETGITTKLWLIVLLILTISTANTIPAKWLESYTLVLCLRDNR